MKKWGLIGLFGLLFLSFTYGNSIVIEVYQLQDLHKKMAIEHVLKSEQFSKIENLNTLNFGISNSNIWLKIVVKNTISDATYKLVLSTITPDTIEVYALKEGILKRELIGEAIPSEERFLNYYFKPTKDTPSVPNVFGMSENTILYLKITGNGQPIALPLSILRTDKGGNTGISSILFSGLLYGIVIFIIIINLVLFISIGEKLYLYFLLFNIFSTGVVLYFDGFVKLFIIPNSGYWNNQFIAIALCGSFIFINYYFHNFLKIKENQPTLTPYFKGINLLFWLILGLSFWQPVGFKWYVIFNIYLTSAEAILLFISVMKVRQKEKEYFIAQLVAISLVIVFGTILQLYYLGLLPVNLLTRYAVHGMILPQILIQAFALSKRFTIMARERLTMQETLLETSEQYSQSLINTLENERKRLSAEFHDSIGQNLLVIRNQILLMLKQNYNAVQKEKLDGLAAITSETLDEIRTISQNLRPTTLDTIGLTASLNNMMERLKRSTEIKIDFYCPQNIDEIIAKDLQINVYRILQELTNNVLKHSKARNCNIEITKKSNQILVTIKDDGVGFDIQKNGIMNTGNGFSSIKERVKILKGDMNILSESEKGTIVNIKIPITNEK